jgi:hypothetical protein
VKPAVGFTLPWAGVTPAPSVEKGAWLRSAHYARSELNATEKRLSSRRAAFHFTFGPIRIRTLKPKIGDGSASSRLDQMAQKGQHLVANIKGLRTANDLIRIVERAI